MRNAYNIWAVMNKNGYGIDPRHGMQVTPVLFPSEDSAKDYLELCKKKLLSKEQELITLRILQLRCRATNSSYLQDFQGLENHH